MGLVVYLENSSLPFPSKERMCVDEVTLAVPELLVVDHVYAIDAHVVRLLLHLAEHVVQGRG